VKVEIEGSISLKRSRGLKGSRCLKCSGGSKGSISLKGYVNQ